MAISTFSKVKAVGLFSVLLVDVALFAAVFAFRLRFVDDQGKWFKWDFVRGAFLALITAGSLWFA
jgi:hypothetical protein